VKTQGGDGHLPAKGGTLEEISPADTLTSDFSLQNNEKVVVSASWCVVPLQRTSLYLVVRVMSKGRQWTCVYVRSVSSSIQPTVTSSCR
jgi:hypothetical protein